MFIFSYFPIHSESIHGFWTILTKGQGHGKIHHEAIPWPLQAKFPAPERMQDLLFIFIPIFILLCNNICCIMPLVLGVFSLSSGKAMHHLTHLPSQGCKAGCGSRWTEGAQAGQERQSSCATSEGKPAAQN